MKIKTKDFEIEFTKEELKDEEFMKMVEDKVIGKRISIVDILRKLLGLSEKKV